MQEKHTIHYTIVICTYNPEERLLKRCLEAVLNLDRTDLGTEVILVDNNSAVPVQGLSYVKGFQKKMPGMKILYVKEQGVQHARIAANEQAMGEYIVYIDSDNEPQPDYLQQLKKLNEAYPRVAAWGPGEVTVDFIDGIAPALEAHAREAFQERHEKEIRYADKHEWQTCYPFGTGLCTKAALLKKYNQLAAGGFFTLSGRSGKKLSSGEDTQMVLLCIKEGFAAGVAPHLRLTHIIPRNRTTIGYLKRLAYGTAVFYETCLCQVFPERKLVLTDQITPAKFSRQVVKKIARLPFQKNPLAVMRVVGFIAMHAGILTATGKPVPWLVRKAIDFLKLD